MKPLIGRWYLGVRIGDLAIGPGVGSPSRALLSQAVLDRPHWPKRLWRQR